MIAGLAITDDVSSSDLEWLPDQLLTRAERRQAAEPDPIHTLTTKQRRIVETIAEYTRITDEPCTANYLARRLRIHHSTVREHLATLYRRGWLLAPNSPASLRLDP